MSRVLLGNPPTVSLNSVSSAPSAVQESSESLRLFTFRRVAFVAPESDQEMDIPA